MPSSIWSRSQEPEPGFLETPTILIPLDVWQKLMGYVLACPVEINGFGYLDRVGNVFQLTDVFILDQVVSSVGADVNDGALSRHMYEMARLGEDTGRLRFQWHSHVNMPTVFSAKDDSTINGYGAEWMISVVINKKGDCNARLDVYKPFRVWTPVNVLVRSTVNNQVSEQCQRDIRQHLRIQEFFFKRRPSERQLAEQGTNYALEAENVAVREAPNES